MLVEDGAQRLGLLQVPGKGPIAVDPQLFALAHQVVQVVLNLLRLVEDQAPGDIVSLLLLIFPDHGRAVRPAVEADVDAQALDVPGAHAVDQVGHQRIVGGIRVDQFVLHLAEDPLLEPSPGKMRPQVHELAHAPLRIAADLLDSALDGGANDRPPNLHSIQNLTPPYRRHGAVRPFILLSYPCAPHFHRDKMAKVSKKATLPRIWVTFGQLRAFVR